MEKAMPLWKVYAPIGAYSDEDKQAMSETITSVYAQIPIPKFYVVTVFEEVADGDLFVGGVKHSRFVRFRVDHMARTLPGPILREWWVRTMDQTLKPWVGDRGFDWEITMDESPSDLWSLQGEIPPPFESIAEKRWVGENRASSYTTDEKLPAAPLLLGPGVTDRQSVGAA
jgi:phenylpyruvate tautomerase PptA (4-oxalocrotonate tautomerase family)